MKAGSKLEAPIQIVEDADAETIGNSHVSLSCPCRQVFSLVCWLLAAMSFKMAIARRLMEHGL